MLLLFRKRSKIENIVVAPRPACKVGSAPNQTGIQNTSSYSHVLLIAASLLLWQIGFFAGWAEADVPNRTAHYVVLATVGGGLCWPTASIRKVRKAAGHVSRRSERILHWNYPIQFREVKIPTTSDKAMEK